MTASSAQEPGRAPERRSDGPSVTASDILRATMGGPARYTVAEVAAAARMTEEEVSRLWRAMGFPTAGSAPVLTDADLRTELRRRGSEQAARYSWRATVTATDAVYEEVAGAAAERKKKRR